MCPSSSPRTSSRTPILALRMHMLPYFKSLYFLPVKFHIEFKIALLTQKCRYGYAPTNLKKFYQLSKMKKFYQLTFRPLLRQLTPDKIENFLVNLEESLSLPEYMASTDLSKLLDLLTLFTNLFFPKRNKAENSTKYQTTLGSRKTY